MEKCSHHIYVLILLNSTSVHTEFDHIFLICWWGFVQNAAIVLTEAARGQRTLAGTRSGYLEVARGQGTLDGFYMLCFFCEWPQTRCGCGCENDGTHFSAEGRPTQTFVDSTKSSSHPSSIPTRPKQHIRHLARSGIVYNLGCAKIQQKELCFCRCVFFALIFHTYCIRVCVVGPSLRTWTSKHANSSSSEAHVSRRLNGV